MKNLSRNPFFAIALLVMAGVSLTQAVPYSFSSGQPALAEEMNSNFDYLAPEHVIYVGKTAGSSEVENGAALIAAMHSFDNMVLDNTLNQSNAYIVRVHPGVYDITGTGSSMVVPSFVRLEGAGRGVTVIKSSAIMGIQMSPASTLTNLTVEFVPSGNPGPTWIYAVSSSPASLIENIEINVAATSALTGDVAGIYQPAGFTVTEASRINNVQINLKETGAGASYSHAGIANTGGTMEINHASIKLSGFGIRSAVVSHGTTNVRNSTLSAENYAKGTGVLNIATTELSGLASMDAGGAITCVFVYNAAFSGTAGSCP